ncbi:MAG TPA: hypothetical protein VM487_21990 [Phycisphaerae bacterium]|nr:hypothetical protein [Phycisphaerae bacterium]
MAKKRKAAGPKAKAASWTRKERRRIERALDVKPKTEAQRRQEQLDSIVGF